MEGQRGLRDFRNRVNMAAGQVMKLHQVWLDQVRPGCSALCQKSVIRIQITANPMTGKAADHTAVKTVGCTRRCFSGKDDNIPFLGAAKDTADDFLENRRICRLTGFVDVSIAILCRVDDF